MKHDVSILFERLDGGWSAGNTLVFPYTIYNTEDHPELRKLAGSSATAAELALTLLDNQSALNI